VGALLSVIFIRGRRSIPLIEREYSITFIIGAALLGAAVGSYYGDELWVGTSYRVIPPDRPRHSRLSQRVSFALGFLGGVLMLVALAQSFGFLS
jgi:hypothetical protein